MQFRLTYQEISDLIARKAGRSIPIMYGGPHTVHIAYEVNVLFKSASIGLDLTVDEVDTEGNIYLSYNGGMGIDFMIRTALNQAKNQPGADMMELLPDNRILLNLSKASQSAAASQGEGASVGSLFDHIRLRDISFDEQFVIVDFEPKNVF
jgi:hypothetical protein